MLYNVSSRVRMATTDYNLPRIPKYEFRTHCAAVNVWEGVKQHHSLSLCVMKEPIYWDRIGETISISAAK